MLKSAVLFQVGQRLGDTTTANLAVLSPIFDEVIRELSLHDAIRSVHKTNTFTFVVNQQNYNTSIITGLSASAPYVYPIDIVRLLVPAWGAGFGTWWPWAGDGISVGNGILTRLSPEEFVQYRLLWTDRDGVNVANTPRAWTLYPNEQQLQICPVADSDHLEDFEIEYLSPPTTLADGDDITEIHLEHIPVVLAGCLKYGAVFKNETQVDMAAATRDWEIGIIRMKTHAQRRRGMAYRTEYRDL